MEIPVTIIEKAKELFNQHLPNFPEDEWFSLAPEWDLNLWLDEEIPTATIYPVVNGETDTQTYYSLPKEVRLNWEEVQAFLRAAYAIEFSIVEGELEKTAFRPCTATVWESSIVFGYYSYDPGENLIIIEKDSLISANLFPSVAQMLLVYSDKRRDWESRLTINFLNKYLPEVY